MSLVSKGGHSHLLNLPSPLTIHCTFGAFILATMKLQILEKAIDTFLRIQNETEAVVWYFPHAMVDTFHTHWVQPDPQTQVHVYDDCLRSDYSQRWWKRDHYRPKEIMLSLISADPELAAIAWKDLSNESASLEGRLDRFDYYCTDLLHMHRQQHIRSVESHHHQDASIISLYLAGMYPDRYSLYTGLDIFQAFCKAVGRPDIPVVDDLVRFMKVAKVVDMYLQKNCRYQAVLDIRMSPMHKVRCRPYQLSYECIQFIGQRYKTDPNDL